MSLYQTLQSCGAPSGRAPGRVGRVARGCLAEGGRQSLEAGSEGPALSSRKNSLCLAGPALREPHFTPMGTPQVTPTGTPGHRDARWGWGPAHKQHVL